MSEIELSFAEEQLWLAEQAGATAFPFFDCTRSLAVVVRLENALSYHALRSSLDEIVRRHDVLRSRFEIRQGQPARARRESSRADFTLIDLRQVGAATRPRVLRQVLERHVTRRFDLTRGPLLRAMLVRLADDEHVFAIAVHHIVFDRWSRRVLAREIRQLYDAFVTGRPSGLEPLRARYRDYVQWQRNRLETASGRELVTYWTAALDGLGPLPLSGDRGRAHVTSTRAGRWHFTIGAPDASRLDATSRRCRVTLATAMLAILAVLLSRLGGERDVAVGVPLPDRRRPEFEPLIGLFANVVIVRTAIAAGLTFPALLARVHRALLDACRYQDLPYGRLLQIVEPATPLYRVVFNFLPEIPASQMGLRGLRVTALKVPAEHLSLADLSFHVGHDSGELACGLVYKADLFSPAWAQAFAVQYQGLVTAVLDEPQKDVGAYDLTACR